MELAVRIVFCLTLVTPLSAQQTSSYRLPIREHIFPNGLRLLVLELPGDHRVAAKIFTDMGALNEIPGQLGAAHFLDAPARPWGPR